eukprot:TRINITY_DN4255_c0_g4_i1.p1 TRINITY_DN4255_c0_g4~~TRINITY_DN4255_c0_g4_i1.p1  ORF type:complete len:125 (+),score=31.33 TRINITY_DN4255_c0_g4_i1:101-475(+)
MCIRDRSRWTPNEGKREPRRKSVTRKKAPKKESSTKKKRSVSRSPLRTSGVKRRISTLETSPSPGFRLPPKHSASRSRSDQRRQRDKSKENRSPTGPPEREKSQREKKIQKLLKRVGKPAKRLA